MKKANTFDNDTLKSLVNSFILALISSIGSFLAALSTGMSPEKAVWPAVGALASFLINVPREYMKGEK